MPVIQTEMRIVGIQQIQPGYITLDLVPVKETTPTEQPDPKQIMHDAFFAGFEGKSKEEIAVAQTIFKGITPMLEQLSMTFPMPYLPHSTLHLREDEYHDLDRPHINQRLTLKFDTDLKVQTPQGVY